MIRQLILAGGRWAGRSP